jgi:hypothetical protein
MRRAVFANGPTDAVKWDRAKDALLFCDGETMSELHSSNRQPRVSRLDDSTKTKPRVTACQVHLQETHEGTILICGGGFMPSGVV